MPKHVSPGDVHIWLEWHFKRQRDIGFGNAIANLILEPPNPFRPEARRKPKAGFVLAAILVTGTLGSFVYFNVVP